MFQEEPRRTFCTRVMFFLELLLLLFLNFKKKQLKFRMLPLAFTLYCKHGFLGFLCQFSKQIYILEGFLTLAMDYILRSPLVSFN